MKFGSLFSGIGGLDLGLERAGWECWWQVEQDDFCRKVLTKRWPYVPKYVDVRYIKELAYVDLICGGFPCQPVSVAGKREGTADERWLWPEFARIIRMVRPRYALIENVPGLLSTNDGGAMSEILGDLASLGYDAEWDCIRTGLHCGHKRSRVFIVAYPDSKGLSSTGKYSKTTIPPLRFFMESTAASLPWPKSAPEVVRNIHGISRRMDRLKALGNAVVPQVAEWVGRRILRVSTV